MGLLNVYQMKTVFIVEDLSSYDAYFVFVYFFKCVSVARNQEQKSRCQAPQFDKALCNNSIVLAAGFHKITHLVAF